MTGYEIPLIKASFNKPPVMRLSIFTLIFFQLFSNPVVGQNSSSKDTVTLHRLINIADSIVSAHTGENNFHLYYEFAPEYSLIYCDTLGNNTVSTWNQNSIDRGTSFDLCYKIKGNRFSFQGIHVYLNRDGSEQQKFSSNPIIPKFVNGKSPTFISRNEANAIAMQYGLKDTFGLFCELKLIPQKDSVSSVFRLHIIFNTASSRPPEKNGDSYYFQTLLIVNPWTKKVIAASKKEVKLPMEIPPVEVIEKKPPEQ